MSWSHPTRRSKTRTTRCPLAQEGPLHRHLVPMFAYLLEGELTVNYGVQGIRSYKAGDALVEAIGVRHRGLNAGTTPVKLLVVYMAANDGPLVER